MVRSIALAGSLTLLLFGGQASGGNDTPNETLRFFNDCAGRVAAHISVHTWNDRKTVTTAHLASMEAIVASFPEADRGEDLARQRSAARAAQVALLQHAMAYGDLDALRRARAHIDQCREAVLAPEAAR
jgi:hypothetical protein